MIGTGPRTGRKVQLEQGFLFGRFQPGKLDFLFRRSFLSRKFSSWKKKAVYHLLSTLNFTENVLYMVVNQCYRGQQSFNSSCSKIAAQLVQKIPNEFVRYRTWICRQVTHPQTDWLKKCGPENSKQSWNYLPSAHFFIAFSFFLIAFMLPWKQGKMPQSTSTQMTENYGKKYFFSFQILV